MTPFLMQYFISKPYFFKKMSRINLYYQVYYHNNYNFSCNYYYNSIKLGAIFAYISILQYWNNTFFNASLELFLLYLVNCWIYGNYNGNIIVIIMVIKIIIIIIINIAIFIVMIFKWRYNNCGRKRKERSAN